MDGEHQRKDKTSRRIVLVWKSNRQLVCSKLELCKGIIEKVTSLHTNCSHQQNSNLDFNLDIQPIRRGSRAYWSIAKLFMPKDTENSEGPQDIDSSALFRLMKKCTIFLNYTRPGHITKVKNARDTLFHSSEYKVEDDKLTEYFDAMELLLTDASNDPEVQRSRQDISDTLKKDVQRLKKLQDGEVDVTMSEKAFDISRKELYRDFKEAIDSKNPKQMRELLELADKTSEELYEIKAHFGNLKEIENYKKNCVADEDIFFVFIVITVVFSLLLRALLV